MGIPEWVAIGGLFLSFIIQIAKGYSDKASMETKIESLSQWKNKMECIDFLPITRCLEERKEFKEEVYKDINRVERRFDDFLRVIEIQNTKIGEVRENVIKILTLLERKEN